MYFINRFKFHLSYFKNINQSQSNKDANLHLKICKCMKYEYYPKGSVLFYEGAPSTKFFIVLEGTCTVLLAKSQLQLYQDQQEQYKKHGKDKLEIDIKRLLRLKQFQRLVHKIIIAQNLLRFVREKYKYKSRKSTIFNYSGSNKQPFQTLNHKKKNNCHIRGFNQEFYIKLRKQILEESHQNIDLFCLQNSQHFFQNNILKYMIGKSYEKGDGFGELGILNNRVRSGTAIASTDLYIVTLTSIQYMIIFQDIFQKFYNKQIKQGFIQISHMNTIQTVQMEKMHKKIGFLRPILMGNSDGVSLEKMTKINYYFEKIKFGFNQKIISQGSVLDKIWLIKKGRYLIIQQKLKRTFIKQNQYLGDVMIYKNQDAVRQVDDQDKIEYYIKNPQIFDKNNKDKQQTSNFQKNLTILSANEIFGEESFIQKQEFYQYNAQVLTQSATLLFISRTKFFRIMEEEYSIHKHIEKNFLLKDQWLQNQIVTQTQMKRKKERLFDIKPKKQKFYMKRSIDEYIQEQQIDPQFVLSPFRRPDINKDSNLFTKKCIEATSSNIKLVKRKKDKKIDLHDLYMFTKEVCFPKREKEKFSTLIKKDLQNSKTIEENKLDFLIKTPQANRQLYKNPNQNQNLTNNKLALTLKTDISIRPSTLQDQEFKNLHTTINSPQSYVQFIINYIIFFLLFQNIFYKSYILLQILHMILMNTSKLIVIQKNHQDQKINLVLIENMYKPQVKYLEQIKKIKIIKQIWVYPQKSFQAINFN